MSRTDAILKRLSGLHPKLIDLSLDRMLPAAGRAGPSPGRLPPVIHVAGTNGKGSTVAYLRAFLEAAGKRCMSIPRPIWCASTSASGWPASWSTRRLNEVLERVEAVNAGRPITYFEITTAAAFMLFAETRPIICCSKWAWAAPMTPPMWSSIRWATIITPVDLDHQAFLGNTIGKIAVKKAGILKRGAPPSSAGRPMKACLIDRAARRLGVTPFVAGQDFDGYEQDGRLVYQDEAGLLDLPPPKLIGAHQFDNAGAGNRRGAPFRIAGGCRGHRAGLRNVVWPARLSPLQRPAARPAAGPAPNCGWMAATMPMARAALARAWPT